MTVPSTPAATAPASSPTMPASDPALAKWRSTIPWVLTIGSATTLAALAWFLVSNVARFEMIAYERAPIAGPHYEIYVYHLHLAMITRSVALFSGFALLFLGTATMFFTLSDASRVRAQNGGVVAEITSASPGLISVFLGVLLLALLSTGLSKVTFSPYGGDARDSTTVTPTR